MNKFDVEIKLTPKVIAEAFWQMGSDEQAQFFQELYSAINKDGTNRFFAELQWCWMTEEVKKLSPEARDMFLSFTSFAYDYWPQKTESQFINQ